MGIPKISRNSRIEAVAKTERQRAKQKLITPGINWSKTKHERAIILEHKRSNLTGNPILSQENRPKRQNFVSTSPKNSDTKPYSAFSGLMHLNENALYKYRFWTISKCACLHVIVAAILVWNKRVMFFSLELIFWFPEVEEQALFVHPYFDYKNTVEHSESIFRQSWSRLICGPIIARFMGNNSALLSSQTSFPWREGNIYSLCWNFSIKLEQWQMK